MINIKEIAEMIINQKQFEQEDFMWLVHNSEVLARAYLELEEKHEYVHKKLLDDIEYQKKEITKLKKSREVLRKACEFYASSDQWNCTKEQLTTYNTIDKDDLGIGDFQFACDVDDDRVGGKKAREALEADDEIMGGGK